MGEHAAGEACAFGAHLGNRSVFILNPRLFSIENFKFVFKSRYKECHTSRNTSLKLVKLTRVIG